MTAEGMIKQLQELIAHGLNPSAEVRAFDGDSGKMELVSGFLYDANQIDLCTDSDDESGPSLSSSGPRPPFIMPIRNSDDKEYFSDIHDACGLVIRVYGGSLDFILARREYVIAAVNAYAGPRPEEKK